MLRLHDEKRRVAGWLAGSMKMMTMLCGDQYQYLVRSGHLPMLWCCAGTGLTCQGLTFYIFTKTVPPPPEPPSCRI